MKPTSSKPNHLIPSKSMAPNTMHAFSNLQNFSKTRSNTVTPNMIRSPPTGLGTGSGIHNLNVENAKPKAYEDNAVRQKNLENMNLGGFSRSSTNSQQKQEKRDFVSMEEALGFLNFINANPTQAFKVPVIPLQQIQQHSQNISRQASQQKSRQKMNKSPHPTPPSQQKQGKQLESQNSANTAKLDELDEEESDDGSLTETKKKLNKNRAIKRIIETAYELLEKNYHFDQNQNQLSEEQRSTSTQFNIYLKQYNRIIEQINSKEYEEIEKSNLLYDQNEDELQEVFQYTVVDDFRERLAAFFTKEKLGKDNVEIMIKAFRDVLVSLKLNQLKVQYFDSSEPPKVIKMSEIQNVQYFTHPYIFIALTINKDKTKSKEQLYLKFSSEENQDKWDRALYCCFMSRKMQKKEKLFEIEFPVEDVMKKEKQEHKKEDEVYEIKNDFHVIDKVFREREGMRSPTSHTPTYTMENEGETNMLSDRPQYMNLTKNRTEEKISIDNDDVRRINTVQTAKNQSPFRNVEINTNVKISQSKKDQLEKEPSIFAHDQLEEESNNFSKKSTFNVNNTNPPQNNEIHPRANTLPHGPQTKPVISPSTNPFMKLLKIVEQEPERKFIQQPQQLPPQQKKPEMPQQLQPNRQQEKLEYEKLLQQKLSKLKKIRQIQKNNVRGIVCQKQKFFMNKQKILFFYDETMLNSSRKLFPQTSEQQALQTVKYLTSQEIQSNKFIEYWDYDYKKDQKQERKLISVLNIVEYQTMPSTLGQTTTSLVIGYNFVGENGKVDKKQLRLIFANPISGGFKETVTFGKNLNNAEEVYEWIKLVKSV